MPRKLVIEFTDTTSWEFIEEVGRQIMRKTPHVLSFKTQEVITCKTCIHSEKSTDKAPCNTCWTHKAWERHP